jgi:hypothetical protein
MLAAAAEVVLLNIKDIADVHHPNIQRLVVAA